MAFRLENNPSRKIPYLVEFGETSRFWYPHVVHDAWIDFSSWTVELQPSKSRKNLPLLFISPFSLSLSLSIRFLFLLFFFASLLSFPFSFLFLSPPPNSPSLGLFLSYFHFLIFLNFLPFLFFFIFYFLFFFSFSPFFLFDPHPSTKFVN